MPPPNQPFDFNPVVAPQAPTPQQAPQPDLMQLLTAIGGLGLNVASVFKGVGPAGSGLLNYSKDDAERKQLQFEKDRSHKESQDEVAKRDAKVAQDRKEEERLTTSLLPQVQKVQDPNVQAEMMALAKDARGKELEARIHQHNQELRIRENQGKSDLAERRYQQTQDSKYIDDAVAEQTKNLNPLVDVSDSIKKYVIPKLTPGDLKNDGNLKWKLDSIESKLKADKVKVDFQKADVKSIRKQLIEATKDQRSFWTGLPEDFNRDAAATNFEKLSIPGGREAHDQARAEIDRLTALKTSVLQPSGNIKSAVGKKTAVAPPPTSGPPAGATRVRNKKTGAEAWQMPDGTIVPIK